MIHIPLPPFLIAFLIVYATIGCAPASSGEIETLCEERLAPSRVKVVPELGKPTLDLTKSYSELTSADKHRADHRGNTLGLTVAALKSSVSFGASGMNFPTRNRYCMRPDITVHLRYSPINVYVGKEFKPGTCQFDEVYRHELKHVDVYREHLATLATKLEAALRENFKNKVYYFSSHREADRNIQEALNVYLSPLVSGGVESVSAWQAQIDTKAEYARIGVACEGKWPTRSQR